MPTDEPLPIDPVDMERALADAVKAVLITVPYIGPVHTRERYPQTDAEDEALTTTDDPVVGDKAPITNVVEIGIPAVEEVEYSSDENTQLTFTYPITYSLGVRDSWAKEGFPYDSSATMFIGVYMRARKAFKQNRTLGYRNCVHFYLQQTAAGAIVNDEGEAREHFAEWSLRIVVTGVKA